MLGWCTNHSNGVDIGPFAGHATWGSTRGFDMDFESFYTSDYGVMNLGWRTNHTLTVLCLCHPQVMQLW